MSVAKVIELTSSSKKSFEDAILTGVARANQTLSNVTGAWVKEQKVNIENGVPTEWRVTMKVTFLLND
jgi:dodecin